MPACTLRSIAESSWVPVALVLGLILGYIIPLDSGSNKLRAPWDRISALVGWTYCELSYSILSILSVPTHTHCARRNPTPRPVRCLWSHTLL